MIEGKTILIAFGLTVFAGLATGIGSALAFFAKRTNEKLLSVSLGLSAGVMIYISFVELFAEARRSLSEHLGAGPGYWLTIISFFGGIAIIALIDKLVPSFGNPHEIHSTEEMDTKDNPEKSKKLYKMGVFTALAIAIHNFPEGIATFASAIKDVRLGIPIAIAIAIHNIPEGIAVSVPVYYATGNRKKAFFLSFLSGVAEPVGALIAYLFFMNAFDGVMMGVTFAAIAGIMVFVSLDELLPTAREYGEHHLSIYGLIAGMIIISISLVLLNP